MINEKKVSGKNLPAVSKALNDKKINVSQVFREAGVFTDMTDDGLRSASSKVKRGKVRVGFDADKDRKVSKHDEYVYITPSELTALMRVLKTIGL